MYLGIPKIHNLIDIGERAGSGIPLIFSAWHKQGWAMPAVTEQADPERTVVKLLFEKTADKKSAISTRVKETILIYLTDHAEAKAAAIAEHIGLKPSRTRDYLSELVSEGSVVAEGSNRNRTDRLKS